jgi:hypothetical protein
MANDQFRQAKEKFFQLKGQLSTGRITQEQFDAALKDLMVQDEQGRYWMIGADSGKWYLHDGQRWVETQPPTGAPQQIQTTPETYSRSQKSNWRLWILGGCAITLLAVIGIGAFIVVSGLFPSPTAMPTQFIFPTITPMSPVVVVQPTQVPVIPTSILPTAIPSSLPTIVLPSPATPVPPSAIPATATPPIPPGLYVTKMRPEPPSPPPATDTSFWVTFLNTTNNPMRYKWKVYIYKPDNLRNSFGETSAVTIDIPAGSSEQTVGMWRITAGACGDYLARVGWIDDNNRITFFTRPDGQMYELAFATCR